MLRAAREIAPVKCADCGSKLGTPQHGFYMNRQRNFQNNGWFINCTCGVTYVWSWDETGKNGGVWKRRSEMPLFDDKARVDNFGKRGQ
jgi:hypothetical protein